jgi:hypothetical protein
MVACPGTRQLPIGAKKTHLLDRAVSGMSGHVLLHAQREARDHDSRLR